MRKYIILLLLTSFATMVGLSAQIVSEVVLTHPDGSVTPRGAIATPAQVNSAATTQAVVIASANSARLAAEAVAASIASMYTNTVVPMTGYCLSANSAAAIPDTNVILRTSLLTVTNGVGNLKFNASKVLTVAPELRFSASIAPKDSFTNIVATCSWPTTVPNDPAFTNGVSYLYTFATTTPNGFYIVYADPMIIPPSGDFLLVSNTINIDNYLGVGTSDEPDICYDRDGKQLTHVGGVAVHAVPEPISTMMVSLGGVPMRLALVRVDQAGKVM